MDPESEITTVWDHVNVTTAMSLLWIAKILDPDEKYKPTITDVLTWAGKRRSDKETAV